MREEESPLSKSCFFVTFYRFYCAFRFKESGTLKKKTYITRKKRLDLWLSKAGSRGMSTGEPKNQTLNRKMCIRLAKTKDISRKLHRPLYPALPSQSCKEKKRKKHHRHICCFLLCQFFQILLLLRMYIWERFKMSRGEKSNNAISPSSLLGHTRFSLRRKILESV